jgi:hypothetical protein
VNARSHSCINLRATGLGRCWAAGDLAERDSKWLTITLGEIVVWCIGVSTPGLRPGDSLVVEAGNRLGEGSLVTLVTGGTTTGSFPAPALCLEVVSSVAEGLVLLKLMVEGLAGEALYLFSGLDSILTLDFAGAFFAGA